MEIAAKVGAPLSEFTREDLTTPGTVVQLGTAPRRIDILTQITAVEFAEAEPTRLIVNIEGLEVPVISRKHLLQNKRAVGRPQHRADVARLEALD